MAAAIIPFDRQTAPMRDVVRALQMIREGVETLGHARAIMIQYCDGSTDTAAHFDLLTAAGAFAAGDYATADAATLAMFAEVDSLYAKLIDTGGSNGATGAALAQCCGKLGV